MANITIYISVRQKSNGTYYLHLSDSEGHTGDDNLFTTGAPGDVVTWTISTALANTTTSIGNIYEKNQAGNYDVFSDGPKAKNDGTGDWTGTVNPQITTQETEAYAIDYNVTVNGSTTTHTDDPDLQIDPPG